MHTLYTGRRDGRSAAMTLWERSMGVEEPRSAREKLIAASPARHVERVQAAVLLIHGRDDAVVPFGQSRSMERALREAGKRVQLVELASEDHWLSEASTRLETMKAIDEFLAPQLGNR
jgi:dipeptidyl aminopeptidase/acylaminoacyl peptidase